MSKLHDCKRGLSTATPQDYNRWWRRIAELEAQYEKLLTKYEHEFDKRAELEARESSWIALLCRDGDARVSAATRIIVKHTESLEDGLRDVGEVHDSWNASDEFKKGWAACREQFRALLDSINNPDSDSKVSTLIEQEKET